MNYFNYFSEIEETFNRRRGKFQFLSPLDWALMESWERRGVPLHVVLRGIEKVFDNQNGANGGGRRRTVKGLSYCREEIEAQYEEWLERQVGKNAAVAEAAANGGAEAAFSRDAINAHFAHVAEELKNARTRAAGDLRETLERVSARLAELAEDYANAETLEGSLSDLEKLLDAALLENARAARDEELNRQITKNLASYKNKMDEPIYRQTFDLMLLKALRERAGIPRLSLFYL